MTEHEPGERVTIQVSVVPYGYDVAGAMPAGWEVHVWRGSEKIGVTQAEHVAESGQAAREYVDFMRNNSQVNKAMMMPMPIFERIWLVE